MAWSTRVNSDDENTSFGMLGIHAKGWKVNIIHPVVDDTERDQKYEFTQREGGERRKPS
jgi:hypothetical protein